MQRFLHCSLSSLPHCLPACLAADPLPSQASRRGSSGCGTRPVRSSQRRPRTLPNFGTQPGAQACVCVGSRCVSVCAVLWPKGHSVGVFAASYAEPVLCTSSAQQSDSNPGHICTSPFFLMFCDCALTRPRPAAPGARSRGLFLPAEPSIEQIEAEFWRIVEDPEEVVESLYGQDVDSGHHGSGFPLPLWRRRLLGLHLAKQAAAQGSVASSVELPGYQDGEPGKACCRVWW